MTKKRIASRRTVIIYEPTCRPGMRCLIFPSFFKGFWSRGKINILIKDCIMYFFFLFFFIAVRFFVLNHRRVIPFHILLLSFVLYPQGVDDGMDFCFHILAMP